MAWHVARFLERVAAAGRAEYDLPMFANAWLMGPNDVPGRYPSGGPVATMLDIWRAAAPHLDFFAPDIYAPTFRQMCAEYHRPGNPLFIPEMHPAPGAAARALYAIGQHQALGCSPFAIEDLPVDSPLADCYALLAAMMPLLCAAQGSGRMRGFLQQADGEEWHAALDGIDFQITAHRPLDANAPCRAARYSLLSGSRNSSSPATTCASTSARSIPRSSPPNSSGSIPVLIPRANGVAQRRLNGDESFHGAGFALGDTLTTYRFKLHCFVSTDNAVIIAWSRL